MAIETRAQWAQSHWSDAVNAVGSSGIFPEVLIVAAIVESQGQVNGIYYPGQSRLALEANNLFGVKGTGDAGFVMMPTREYLNGQWVTVNAKFAKYSSVYASMVDYVDFLKRNPRYTAGGVFSASTPVEQFQRLQASGYATDPNYAGILSNVYNNLLSVFNSLPRMVKNTGALLFGFLSVYLLFRYVLNSDNSK